LAWVNARCPPKLLYHSPSAAEQERGNMMREKQTKTGTVLEIRK